MAKGSGYASGFEHCLLTGRSWSQAQSWWKPGWWSFRNAAEDLGEDFGNLKPGKFTHSRTQIKGVSQNINYTTVALLPSLTSILKARAQHQSLGDLPELIHAICHGLMCTQLQIFRSVWFIPLGWPSGQSRDKSIPHFFLANLKKNSTWGDEIPKYQFINTHLFPTVLRTRVFHPLALILSHKRAHLKRLSVKSA